MAHPDMTEKPLDLKRAEADGATVTTPKDIVGRLNYADESLAQTMSEKPELAEGLQKSFDQAATPGFRYPKGDKRPGIIKDKKDHYPELTPPSSRDKDQKRNIARHLANDYAAMNEMAQAAKDDRYIEIQHKDGSTERGIIADKENPKRVGMWISRDEKGQVRQIASFNEKGETHGSVFEYGEDQQQGRQLVARGYYRNGQKDGSFYEYENGGMKAKITDYDKGQVTGTREKDYEAEAKAKAQAAEAQQFAHSFQNM